MGAPDWENAHSKSTKQEHTQEFKVYGCVEATVSMLFL